MKEDFEENVEEVNRLMKEDFEENVEEFSEDTEDVVEGTKEINLEVGNPTPVIPTHQQVLDAGYPESSVQSIIDRATETVQKWEKEHGELNEVKPHSSSAVTNYKAPTDVVDKDTHGSSAVNRH